MSECGAKNVMNPKLVCNSPKNHAPGVHIMFDGHGGATGWLESPREAMDRQTRYLDFVYGDKT